MLLPASIDQAIENNIESENIVEFPNWVGGRYSVWSGVSLSVALVIGIKRFKELLSGARDVDNHFLETPLQSNFCFIAAMMDHYYVNYWGAQSRGIFAYDYRLRSIVDYLQQLETESNGKDRQISGEEVDQKTASVVWGGVGTDVQHSVFQLLHQGTLLIPAEFILVRKAAHNHTDHHQALLANAIAQPAALLQGQTEAEVRSLFTEDELSDIEVKAKIFSGERPSTTILIDELTPSSLGSLLAFYEHRTFCNGVLTNINSFDQMGVELGKRLARSVEPILGEERMLRNVKRTLISRRNT